MKGVLHHDHFLALGIDLHLQRGTMPLEISLDYLSCQCPILGGTDRHETDTALKLNKLTYFFWKEVRSLRFQVSVMVPLAEIM
jgi:hypothetical protein